MLEHLRAQGRTPAGTHVPILVDAVLAVLCPRPGEVVADCTLGYGGHAVAFLEHIAPGGLLVGFDVDAEQLARTSARLRRLADGPGMRAGVRTFRRNYAGLTGTLATLTPAEGGSPPNGYDVIFADLGVSSMQLDDPARGFSYRHDGPLDMRLDQRLPRTAADWLRVLPETALADALHEFADEPDAAAIAAALVTRRGTAPLTRTGELAALVCDVKRRRDRSAAARTFQALRILVNDELGALRGLLRAAPQGLRPGGRIGILTFHSGEDRLVKHAFRDGLRAGVYAEISPEPLRPDAAERRSNPRSAAAKLRWARRVGG